MPNINRPVRNHKTGFHTDKGDTWEPFTDEKKQIPILINAFMMINRRIIDNKTVKRTCNAAFSKLPGGRDFEAVWRDPGIWVSLNPNTATNYFGIKNNKDLAIGFRVFDLPN